MEIRLVRKSDCDLLYEWVNEKDVRKNSLNSDPIPYEVHKEWFHSMLIQSNVRIYIALHQQIAIGMGRICMNDGIATVSYSIDKKFRGQGFGTQLISILTQKIMDEHKEIKQIVGIVKMENYASRQIFEKNGYIVRNSSIHKDTVEYILLMRD